MKHSIECPKCQSNKVTPQHAGFVLILFGCMILIIPIIGWIIGPIMWVMALIRLFGKKKVFKCQECQNGFTVDKKVYKEFKTIQ